MVSFSCESCHDVLVKKKLDAHVNRCRGAQFTCLDCSTTFGGTSYREHTSCISEAQKYQKSVYRPEKKKGKENGKGKDKETDKIKPSQSNQHGQDDNDRNGMGSHNGNVKNGGDKSGALNINPLCKGYTSQSDEQKEAEKGKDREAKEYEAKEKWRTENNKGNEEREETSAMKNTTEKEDKKRKRKSSEVDVNEGEGSADKLSTKKKKGEEPEGKVKKQPKGKKSKNTDTKKSEEKTSVPPVLVPSPESKHKHDDSSIPSTTVNEDNAHQSLAPSTPAPTGVELPPSKALLSDHFLNSIPTGKEISMVRLIKKLKKTSSESEVWEFLKRAKVAKDKAGKVALVLP